jgi:hypothetical protein
MAHHLIANLMLMGRLYQQAPLTKIFVNIFSVETFDLIDKQSMD